jgi:hypothetical protein
MFGIGNYSYMLREEARDGDMFGKRGYDLTYKEYQEAGGAEVELYGGGTNNNSPLHRNSGLSPEQKRAAEERQYKYGDMF